MDPDQGPSLGQIYEWLRSKQTIVTSSGWGYEVPRLREAADEIERWRKIAEMLYHAIDCADDAHRLEAQTAYLEACRD